MSSQYRNFMYFSANCASLFTFVAKMIAVAGRRRRRRRRRAAAPLATENKVPANVSVQHMGNF